MYDILNSYDPITLAEMTSVKLLNRTDTKFVTTATQLRSLLLMAQQQYRVQTVDGKRMANYYTVYYDTPRHDLYMAHHNGCAGRQKLRIRSYVDSRLNFLEVKTKNNHGRTHKERIAFDGFDAMRPDHNLVFDANDAYTQFVCQHICCDASLLGQQLENRFRRITLVNRAMTERLTIDTGLVIDNLQTGRHADLSCLAIIELKRDGLQPSPVLGMLRQLRIAPMGFSKYAVGTALTNTEVKSNRLKPRLRKIWKMNCGNILNVDDVLNTDLTD